MNTTKDISKMPSDIAIISTNTLLLKMFFILNIIATTRTSTTTATTITGLKNVNSEQQSGPQLSSSGWKDPVLQQASPIYLENYSEHCRHKSYLPPIFFELETCAWCYKYMINSSHTFGEDKLDVSSELWSNEEVIVRILVLQGGGVKILANTSDPDSPIWDTFANNKAKKDWVDCCSSAKRCCERQLKIAEDNNKRMQSSIYSTTTTPLCPATWDGWQCWDETIGGTTANSFCPPYIYFHTEPPSCAIPLEKKCDSGGRWSSRTPSNASSPPNPEWTDYSKCGSATVSLQLRRAYVLIAAYALSIITILPALFIFFAYKQLRVHRIILHQNLFISMLMNGILVIVFKTVVMLNEINPSLKYSLIEDNNPFCRLLLVLTKYSRMTNYMWMFCEGFYLHKLIAASFAEQKSLLVFYLLGWGFPLIPTGIYAVYRLGWANEKCWVLPEEGWEWVLNGPSLLSLITNALFLINIIRVLVTKLRATHTQEPSQYRKAVRATLVLLPLFGLHFLVTIYRPPTSEGVCLWTEIYFYANDILDGIQGFLVALIFCYFNGEVSTLLKRSYVRVKQEYCGASSRSNRRNCRQGSFLGGNKSVMSTHVYSSVPPSPETNCLTTVIELDGGVGGGDAFGCSSTNANSLFLNNGKQQTVNLMVVTKANEESSSV